MPPSLGDVFKGKELTKGQLTALLPLLFSGAGRNPGAEFASQATITLCPEGIRKGWLPEELLGHCKACEVCASHRAGQDTSQRGISPLPRSFTAARGRGKAALPCCPIRYVCHTKGLRNGNVGEKKCEMLSICNQPACRGDN